MVLELGPVSESAAELLVGEVVVISVVDIMLDEQVGQAVEVRVTVAVASDSVVNPSQVPSNGDVSDAMDVLVLGGAVTVVSESVLVGNPPPFSAIICGLTDGFILAKLVGHDPPALLLPLLLPMLVMLDGDPDPPNDWGYSQVAESLGESALNPFAYSTSYPGWGYTTSLPSIVTQPLTLSWLATHIPGNALNSPLPPFPPSTSTAAQDM